MSYQVLARRLRPSKFKEVVGQDHIVRSLKNAISRNIIGHAYLFTGTRGTGKTTIARIFAKSLRCENLSTDIEPCNECTSCLELKGSSSLDVIEIDGASHNGVDDVRELIERVQFLPTKGQYKVVILDEVHMLSNNAFNALLKTLEEPPKHVVFIFATTEPEKLLPTVISRCQRFDFKNAISLTLKEYIKDVLEKEGYKLENESLVNTISELGDGSYRDTLSNLDQAMAFSENNLITEESLTTSLGLVSTTSIRELIENILLGNEPGFKKIINNILESNVLIENISKSYLRELFQLIESIDDKEFVKSCYPNFYKQWDSYSTAELIWVYEHSAKELEWILDSLFPVQALMIHFKKVLMRREYFSSTQKKTKEIIEPTKSEIENEVEELAEEATEDKEEAVAVVEKTKEEVIHNKDWEGFLKFLNSVSPASASNLEQGNLVRPISYDGSSLTLELGFGPAEKVFYDYISEVQTKERLKEKLLSFFAIDLENLNFHITLLDGKSKEEKNFMSLAEIDRKKLEDERAQKKEDLLNHPMLKEAESLFQTKIDKIVIDD